MSQPKTLPAFTTEEYERAHTALAAKVAVMMGRKFEEGDWAEVYCHAKNIPNTGWSNLKLDIVHEGLGIEHKMLRYTARPDITLACGTRHMHPSATRSFRMPSVSIDPNEAMKQVLIQYQELIQARYAAIRENTPTDKSVELRTGWLIWQTSLKQFLYFEEEMLLPDPEDYFAEWHSRGPQGARKGSTNLWIYEKATRQKRFSVTNEAGAKIQPYFDIPPASDQHLYVFTVIGEYVDIDHVRVWLTRSTIRELERLLGDSDPQAINDAILQLSKRLSETRTKTYTPGENVIPMIISAKAYKVLTSALPGKSDEHCFQQLVDLLHSRR
jgi:hypothetical protein